MPTSTLAKTMREYRLTNLPEALLSRLNSLNIQVVEESFRRKKKSWLVYSDEKLERVLNAFSVSFEKKDISESGWETLWHKYIEEGWLTDDYYYCFKDTHFEDGRSYIRINPAFAFGTGSHPTTKLAARLLEPVARGASVLDIGTGSGILSILASKSGAKQVYACDTDEFALVNARENAKLNSCGNISFWAGGVESVKTSFKPQVVAANIISSVLTDIHPKILVHRPKYIIYSGILTREGNGFLSALNTHGYQPDAVEHMRQWSALRLKADAGIAEPFP